MKVKKILGIVFLLAAAVLLPAVNGSAQETMMKEKAKPFVAVIKADWCPYCKRVEPVIAGLMNDYGEKMQFIMFDVTDAAAIAESEKNAKMLGLSEFFKDFRKKTSTVAVIKDGEITYKTSNNSKREDYVAAFDAALK